MVSVRDRIRVVRVTVRVRDWGLGIRDRVIGAGSFSSSLSVSS